MSNTFLLKNALGQIAGFLIQNDKKIVYKIDQKIGDEVEIVFRFDDNSLERKRVVLDGKEGILSGGIKKITGVVVIAENEDVLFRAGRAGDDFHVSVRKNKAQPRVIIEADKNEIRAKKQTCKIETGHDMTHTQQKEKTVSENWWPQRRWPPPPCMCYAAYYNGKWKNEK